MTIRREDLADAAALGLLQYRQVDPLLVFLLQRDVREKRLLLAAQAHRPRRNWAYGAITVVAALVTSVTMAMFGLLFSMRPEPASVGVLFSFAGLYMLIALGAVGWFNRRAQRGPTRTLSALAVATVPLAVFTLTQIT